MSKRMFEGPFSVSIFCHSLAPTFQLADGSLVEYMVAPAKDVTRIPAELKSEIVAPLLCGQ
jgi:D-arabinose 1-dehydrogenase-like Zn-dependent alcohol dehydrogenase